MIAGKKLRHFLFSEILLKIAFRSFQDFICALMAGWGTVHPQSRAPFFKIFGRFRQNFWFVDGLRPSTNQKFCRKRPKILKNGRIQGLGVPHLVCEGGSSKFRDTEFFVQSRGSKFAFFVHKSPKLVFFVQKCPKLQFVIHLFRYSKLEFFPASSKLKLS